MEKKPGWTLSALCPVSFLPIGLVTLICLLSAGGARGEGTPGASPSDQEEAKEAQAPASAPAEGGAEPAVLRAPDFTIKDLKGRTVHLAELLKKGPVFLDFWTSWCTPCKREMPELDRIYKTYKSKGFSVVAIAQDDTRTVAKVKPYIDSNKFEFIAASDPTKSVGNLYSVRQYPTSFLIRKDGTVAHFAQAYLPGDEKQVEALVRELLGLAPEEKGAGEAK